VIRIPYYGFKLRKETKTQQGLHHVAHESITGETDEDFFHDSHLELQERMRNPIAFHAEMMGDIMYLNQALQQSDAKEFVQAVVKEVNGHVDSSNRTLKKRSEVPDDAQNLLYGPCGASAISQLTKSSLTRHN